MTKEVLQVLRRGALLYRVEDRGLDNEKPVVIEYKLAQEKLTTYQLRGDRADIRLDEQTHLPATHLERVSKVQLVNSFAPTPAEAVAKFIARHKLDVEMKQSALNNATTRRANGEAWAAKWKGEIHRKPIEHRSR